MQLLALKLDSEDHALVAVFPALLLLGDAAEEQLFEVDPFVFAISQKVGQWFFDFSKKPSRDGAYFLEAKTLAVVLEDKERLGGNEADYVI